MDRILVQPSEIPTDTMFLATNKNTMIALGYLAQAILGSGPQVDGFACTPTAPASLDVQLSTGSIFSLQNVDSTPYGTMAADTADQIIKQGILLGTTTLSCPAPATTGQSINYLVQVAFSETDTNAQNVQFYNSANPSDPLTENINTLRQQTCVLSAKAGAAATTGTQTTPAPDAGYVGLWAITVANGQTTITSGNIAQLSSAPFISPKLTGMIANLQSGAPFYAQDTSGSGTTITISLTPAITSYGAGQEFRVKLANTNTGNPVMNVNGLGNKAVVDGSGNPIVGGRLKANGLYTFIYDGTNMVLQSIPTDAISGGFKNLKIATSSTTAATITADELVLSDGNGNSVRLFGLNVSYATGTSGANGLDTGALSASTGYYEWVIYNPSTSTTASLLSLSSTAPTLPSGYTFRARVGWSYVDGSSRLRYKIQYGRDAQYVVGAVPSVLLAIATGSAGNPSTPTYVAVSTSGFVPPTAGKIMVSLAVSGSAAVHAIAAPNNSYGNTPSAAYMSLTCPAGSTGYGAYCVQNMLLESSNVYYAADASAASLNCIGWTDNL